MARYVWFGGGLFSHFSHVTWSASDCLLLFVLQSVQTSVLVKIPLVITLIQTIVLGLSSASLGTLLWKCLVPQRLSGDLSVMTTGPVIIHTMLIVVVGQVSTVSFCFIF